MEPRELGGRATPKQVCSLLSQLIFISFCIVDRNAKTLQLQPAVVVLQRYSTLFLVL